MPQVNDENNSVAADAAAAAAAAAAYTMHERVIKHQRLKQGVLFAFACNCQMERRRRRQHERQLQPELDVGGPRVRGNAAVVGDSGEVGAAEHAIAQRQRCEQVHGHGAYTAIWQDEFAIFLQKVVSIERGFGFDMQ